MKKWEQPELNDLKLGETRDSEECPYSSEAENTPAPMTLFPVFVWGDGKIGCTYWDSAKKGCTNPSYGKCGNFWPCPPAGQDPQIS